MVDRLGPGGESTAGEGRAPGGLGGGWGAEALRAWLDGRLSGGQSMKVEHVNLGARMSHAENEMLSH